MKNTTSHPSLTPYGLLLALDGYGASTETCGDVALLYHILETLPAYIGMRPLGHPHIVSVQEEGIRGLSGFTFIMESHISIHTYEERGFVTADVYSCKEFDMEKTTRFLVEAFGIKSFETNSIVRGIQFNETLFFDEAAGPRKRGPAEVPSVP